MSLYEGVLGNEEQDAVVYNARVGDVEQLQEIFTTILSPKLLRTSLDEESKSSALHMSAANGEVETVKYVLETVKENSTAEELKEFVNLKNSEDNTALHWASLNGHLEVVKILCDEYDADPFIRNKIGHDAIFEAEQNGKEDVENYFLQKYDVEPESDEEDDAEIATVDNVHVSAGKEIESITKEDEAALKSKTEEAKLAAKTEALSLDN